MTCPAREALAAWVDDQTSAEQITQHVAECTACAQHATRLRALVIALTQVELARPAPSFSAGVVAKLRAAPVRRSSARTFAAASVALACVALLGFLQFRSGFEARGGGSSSQNQLGFEVYVHEPGRAATRLVAGQQVNGAAGYSFVVRNRSQQQQYLMLFAVDARAEVHWFFPAFVDPASDPRSMVVPATPQVRALPEGITPETPALGPVRFVALFSAAPLTVSDVEARMRAGGLEALARAHPQLQIVPAVLRSEGRVP